MNTVLLLSDVFLLLASLFLLRQLNQIKRTRKLHKRLPR